MSRYLFSSHDGYGLGHVRRNTLIARAVLDGDPEAEVTVITGIPVRPTWLDHARINVVVVPELLKDTDGAYRNGSMSFHDAVRARAAAFRTVVADWRPDVTVVDRHPYGTAGELRDGIDLARRQGGRVVLGLRDVLDDAERVAEELAGDGWRDVAECFDQVLVYGSRGLCDHEAEYGLAVTPTYCGWVAPSAPLARPQITPRHLVVAAGGGGDGAATFELGLDLVRRRPDWTAEILAGPYAARWQTTADPDLARRVQVVRGADGCVERFARAGAVLQMAGYNSTVEALAAGVRPILAPRRAPRREQAIRATRLAALGLADVVDERAPAAEVEWLLDRPRTLAAGAARAVGLRFDGAQVAAGHLRRQAALALSVSR